MKTETSPQAGAAEAPADDASGQAAVQIALDRRDNGGRAPGQHRPGAENDR